MVSFRTCSTVTLIINFEFDIFVEEAFSTLWHSWDQHTIEVPFFSI